MTDDPAQPATRGCGCQLGKILREAAVVAVIGAAFAFFANQFSPRGLRLTTNYFPAGARVSQVASSPWPWPLPGAKGAGNAAPTAPAASALLAARFEKEGLHLVERAEVEKLFHDPRRQQDLILFIDARDEDHYGEGHIPGAFPFDPFHPEKYLADVLPACQVADQIIVYCTGGDCENSETAALFLRDAGVPAAKLFIYGGGITDWEAAGLPEEIGARYSGNVRKPGS